MNLVIMRALFHLHRYYGDDFKVECPTGSGRMLNLRQVSIEIGRRLSSTFLRDEDGRRPVYGGIEKFQTDPHWRDLILFHEYFHGDNGAGLGASHQTGWTGTVALLLGLDAVTIYEINTAVWLGGRRLDEVSWDAIPDVDAVWLMGVWQRSPAGREIALRDVPGAAADDVIGSPYCVRDYVVDERFGGPEALAHARARARRARPEADPRLRPQPRRARPPVGGRASRTASSTGRTASSRTAATRTSRRGPTSSSSTRSRPSCARRSPRLLIAIADQCDGVRCDMAMLMTNEVFARTWELRAAGARSSGRR